MDVEMVDCTQKICEDYNKLLRAVAHGHHAVLKDLITSGCDINLNLNEDIGTALHYSIETSNLDAFRVLLTHGADVEALVQYHHQTPLMRACEFGHLEMVEALLQAGADINRQTDGCSTALIIACHFGFQNIAEFLLDKGADATLKNRWGFTALYMSTDSPIILQRMLQERVSVNDQCGERKETPLHLAAVVGSLEACSLLLKAGAHVNALTRFNETPLWLAAWKHHGDLVKLFIEHNCDVDTPSNGCEVYLHKYTPLELALGDNDIEMTLALVKAGCKTINITCFQEREAGSDLRYSWIRLRKEILDYIDAEKVLLENCTELFCNPRNLQNLCILCIRQVICSDFVKKVNDLPVPKRIRELIRKVYMVNV